jgi:integrase
MTLYQRGKVWWYEFEFRGQRIRESSHSRTRSIAERIERERRRQFELGSVGLKEHRTPQMFSVTSKKWLEASKTHWSANNYRIESINLGHLVPHFGRKLLVDISGDDISRYQAARKEEGASPRTVNMEVGTLRAILRKHRVWANIQPDVRMLKTRGEIGRALSADEQHRLLTACKKVRSRSLYPAVLLSLHTGLRNAELRLLRWRQIDFIEEQLVVGKSKTAGGEGRGSRSAKPHSRHCKSGDARSLTPRLRITSSRPSAMGLLGRKAPWKARSYPTRSIRRSRSDPGR